VQRLLAVLLVLVGLIGLALGRLGDTVWAPDTETTASVTLEDPGPAVVIDPGVLYVGGEEGEVTIEGASDVSVITASNGDIDAYLDGVHHTRITGASDWSTLSTEDVDPDGEAEISDPTSSDLWRSVDTSESPYTLDVHEFWAGENGENEQVYRALLIVADGTEPGAESVSITWPVDAENEWVPYAYAGGAAVAVIGLVLLVVSLGRRRDEDEEELAPVEGEELASGAVDADAADDAEDEDPVAAEDSVAAEDPLDAPGAREVGEQNVWAFGSADSDAPADDADGPADDGDAPADDGTDEPAADDAGKGPASEEDQQR
jgi:hypothetical protein